MKDFKQVLGELEKWARIEKCYQENLCFISLNPLEKDAVGVKLSFAPHAPGQRAVTPLFLNFTDKDGIEVEADISGGIRVNPKYIKY